MASCDKSPRSPGRLALHVASPATASPAHPSFPVCLHPPGADLSLSDEVVHVTHFAEVLKHRDHKRHPCVCAFRVEQPTLGKSERRTLVLDY